MGQYSSTQLKTLAWVPRLAALVGLASAVFMGWTAYRQCCRPPGQRHGTSLLYHRFMMAMAVHLSLFSAANVVGTAAIPRDTPNTWGAVGNVTTCSAQGFVIQLSLCAPFYYVLLSLYSFLAVWHNFHLERYLWVEKWIHVGVHLFPVGSAVYLLSLQAYNQPGEVPGTTCWIDSLPFGCGDQHADTLPCTRGPQHISQVAGIFAGLPVLFILVFPAVVMGALYLQVRRHQARICLPAQAVAQQATVYLAALYWTYALTIIGYSLGWKADKGTGFGLRITGTVIMNLFGFWILLIYYYFWMPPQATVATTTGATSGPKTNHSPTATGVGKESATTARKEASPSPTMVSFNIFDGTNATGAFADFVFAGDSDDEAMDRQESQRWTTIQNHV